MVGHANVRFSANQKVSSSRALGRVETPLPEVRIKREVQERKVGETGLRSKASVYYSLDDRNVVRESDK